MTFHGGDLDRDDDPARGDIGAEGRVLGFGHDRDAVGLGVGRQFLNLLQVRAWAVSSDPPWIA